MNKLVAIAKLTRIEHSIMLVIAVIAAEQIAGGMPPVGIFLLSLVTPIFVSMGAFAINDYFDVNADRVNKRLDRPIVAGTITKKEAFNIAVLCSAIGVLASFLININAFVIAFIFGALSFLYSYKLKDVVLIGNAYIALSMVIPFVYGDFVVSRFIPTSIVLISFIIFLSGLGREIHGMIRDREGDAAARRSKNLVHYMGVKSSSYFAFILYIEAVAISIFMFLYQWPFAHNLNYLAPIALADLMLIYVAFVALFVHTRKFFNLSRNMSLAAMGIALFAFLIGSVLPVAAI